MSTYLDALLSGQSKARSLATSEDAVDVDVSESAPPNPGDVLTAGDSSHATWQPPSGGDGTAVELGSTGAPINVDGAEPPVAGQVLTATDPEHAVWRVPGLHYDPSIKFWTSSVGSATIAPGTWGFVQAPVGGTASVAVYIVSSLEAPPIDSRFALYVGRDVTVHVTVNVLGASQIQGLDGVLGPSTTLIPGADYEWVFYHEDGAALWGLVSDTAGVAKSLRVTGGEPVVVSASAPPSPGYVLTAVDATHAEWEPPGGADGTAANLITTTGFVNVSGSAAPSGGQTLVAVGPTSARWQSPYARSLKDFGAVGDGVADDTAAVQAAVSAVIASGEVLYVPPGTFKLINEILISGTITITGAGILSVLYQSNPGKNLFTATADVSYSVFERMKWLGAGEGTGAVSMGFAAFLGPNVLLRFRDLEIMHFPQCALYLPDSFCCSIDSCLIRYNGTVGTLPGGNALACSDSYGGGVRYGKITFTGSACTGNSFHSTYIANCGRGVYVDGNQRVVSHGFLNTKVELCYIGIDIDGRGSTTTVSRSNWLGADCYFEANKFAGATMGEGTMVNTYRNDTTPGTGLPGSWSTAGPDGVQFAARFNALTDAAVQIGNRLSVKPIAFAVDKSDATNVVSTMRVLNTGALVLTSGSAAADTTEVALYSGSGGPEGSVAAQTGSLYLRHNGSEHGNTVYIKITGDGTNTGWQPLGAQQGPTSARPPSVVTNRGQQYYDTDILRVVTSNGLGLWREYNGLTTVRATLAELPDHRTGASFWANDAAAELVSDGSRWRQKYVVPVFGPAADAGTTTIPPRGGYVVNTGLPIASHTLVLPSGANAVSGDKVVFATTSAITTFTVSAGAATVTGIPPGTLAGSTSIEYVYNDSNTTWYRVR